MGVKGAKEVKGVRGAYREPWNQGGQGIPVSQGRHLKGIKEAKGVKGVMGGA